MRITGTHINYFFVCRRKLWFFANEIYMEHESELVEEGRFIHETAYPRRTNKYKEILIDAIRIDYYDPKQKVIYEIKKSDKLEPAHIWQLKYYIYVLKQNGIEGVTGVLEYPKMRVRRKITLKEGDEQKINLLLSAIEKVISAPKPPKAVKKTFCRRWLL